MVVFTCGHCGESLQKPKVEKHYMTKCRNRNPNLSCMDCFKDFFGNDYEAHTKCITEEQRYSGKGFVAKEKKGEQKQNTWIELVQSVLDEQLNAPPNVRKIITAISNHTNTPRKKPKFVNFVKNICGNKTNPKDIDAAWDLISVKLSALSNNNQNKNQNQKQNGNVDAKLELENSTVENDENNVSSSSDSKLTNGDSEKAEKDLVNGKDDDECVVSGKTERKSKKQLKAEKKQKKYEAELQKAAQAPEEEDDDGEEKEHKNKKDKKKNKADSTTNDEDIDSKNKKKRKRLDTTNSVTAEPANNGANELSVESLKINGEKTKKKKPKINQQEEVEEESGVCLHDQNVANTNTEEHEFTSDKKFNWHAVILSVLEKKGNEMPFKRLQKKVLSQYSEDTGREVDDRIADKFIKKLRSAPNVKVDKNTVYIED